MLDYSNNESSAIHNFDEPNEGASSIIRDYRGLRRGGVADEEQYAQVSNTKKNQNMKGAVASIVGFANLPTNTYETMLKAVATLGPVVINVAASHWGMYSSGVFDDKADNRTTTRDINHCVVLEGYGTDEVSGQDYWLVRNSWSPMWGENGYIRLKRVDPSTLDDPELDCMLDNHPADGIACTKDDDGNDVTPPDVKVCGTSGVLYDGVVPIGGHLL